MMKNGVYFIVIALLVAKLFKILIYANLWRHFVNTSGIKSHKIEYLSQLFLYRVET